MSGLDPKISFKPVTIALMTVSDSRTLENDKSGDILVKKIEEAGHHLAERLIMPDEPDQIAARLRIWIDDPHIDVGIATGGTGLTGRDSTPEAFQSVYEKEIPGFGEVFRMLSYAKIGASTIQSRTTAGVANRTYLFALPGSPGACRDAWEDILKWQLDSRFRPCNLVDLMPRLKEK